MVMYDLVLVVVSINNENMATDTLPNRYVEEPRPDMLGGSGVRNEMKSLLVSFNLRA